jgi:hypothetical protein
MSALIGKLRSIGNRDLSGALNERAFDFDDVSIAEEAGRVGLWDQQWRYRLCYSSGVAMGW